MLSKLRFRPMLWPTLFSIPAFLVMVGLCLWQVQRMYWKEALIAEREARVSAEPIALPVAGADLTDIEYRRVRIEGAFHHDKELYLGARSMKGNAGYHVVTPMTLVDGTTVLVDRGWVPVERKAPESRPEGQLAGPQTIDGIIRLPHGKAWMQPDNEPQHNMYFYVDPAGMAAALAMAVRPDLYVDAGPAPNPGKYPVGGQTHIEMPNDHLQYAITWGLLALILAVIYVAFHLKLERERRAQEQQRASE